MRKRIRFLIIAFLTFVFLTFICHFIFLPKGMDKVKILNDDWEVSINGETYSDVELTSFRRMLGYIPGEGDIISMCRTISGADECIFPVLIYFTRFSASEVYVNDTLFSQKEMEKWGEGKFVGVHYNIITFDKLPETFKLEIRLYVSEDYAYPYFTAPIFGSFKDGLLYIIFRNIFALAAGGFLIIIGAVFFLISLSFYKTLPDILGQLFSSLLFIDLGIWILSFYHLTDFFMNTNGHMTEAEYFTLYLILPMTYMIIGCIKQHYKDWIFMVIASTSTIICIFLLIMHCTGIAHVNRTLPYFHTVGIVTFIFEMVVITRDFMEKNLKPEDKIQLLGLAFLGMSFIVHFLLFGLEVVGISPVHFNIKRAIPIGGLGFVFATLINYFIYISESYARRKEYASLTHLAYADGLTDLPNRSRYDKYMEDLQKNKKSYCVVSLDLNGLKQVNDNEGHALGDKYLKEFSMILQQSFGNKAFLARIGGDEFVAILTDEYWGEIDTILTRLRDALEVKNILYPEYRRSVAAGYAFSTEIDDSDPHTVYLLADKRMYENKKIMHEKMGTTPRI